MISSCSIILFLCSPIFRSEEKKNRGRDSGGIDSSCVAIAGALTLSYIAIVVASFLSYEAIARLYHFRTARDGVGIITMDIDPWSFVLGLWS